MQRVWFCYGGFVGVKRGQRLKGQNLGFGKDFQQHTCKVVIYKANGKLRLLGFVFVLFLFVSG